MAVAVTRAAGSFPHPSVGTQQAFLGTSGRQEAGESQPTNPLPFALEWVRAQGLVFHAASPEASQGGEHVDLMRVWSVPSGSWGAVARTERPPVVFCPLCPHPRCLGWHLPKTRLASGAPTLRLGAEGGSRARGPSGSFQKGAAHLSGRRATGPVEL